MCETTSSVRVTQRVILRTRAGQRHSHQSLGPPAGTGRLSSPWLQLLVVVMSLFVAVLFELMEADGRRLSAGSMISLMVLSTGTLALAWRVRRRAERGQELVFVTPLLLAVVTGSLLWEPCSRSWFQQGRPFETMVMFSQKNLMLALAVFAMNAGRQRLAVLLGVMLSVFCVAVSSDRTLQWLVGGVALLGLCWLTGSYWDALRMRLVPADGSGRRWWLAVSGLLIPLLIWSSQTTAGNTVILALKGILPASGGTGDSDPFSRGGVHDGDALVKGMDNIQSFGPVEDAPFAEDDKPSLYDMFNDTFEEPVRPIGKQESSVALEPELTVHLHQRMAEMRQAAREFSTRRTEKRKDGRRVQDLNSQAMFYVAGRVPVHLRMELYDVFDGTTWWPEDRRADGPQMSITPHSGKPWLRWPVSKRRSLFSDAETHAIRVINLKSPVIPCPPDTRGIHIDQVNRSDMFDWAHEDIVKMTRDSLPELTTIHILSERLSFDELRHDPDLIIPRSSSTDPLRFQLPRSLHRVAIRQLAEQWTQGLPRGWPQVEAIISRLQENYILDRDFRPPVDCEFPVGEFLFRSRRGAEYMFASAAVLLLRSLEYPTRLVGGFYGNPEHYDADQRQTAVFASDTHVWCEVSLGGGTWATVEASPGYEVLMPELTLRERLLAGLLQLAEWARRHWLMLSLTGVSGAVLFRFRQSVADTTATLIWHWLPARTTAGRVLQTNRLLERRLNSLGLTRPPGMTLTRWLRHSELPHAQADSLRQFAQLLNQTLFAGSCSGDAGYRQTIEACCRGVSLRISRQSLRQHLQNARTVHCSHPSPGSLRQPSTC